MKKIHALWQMWTNLDNVLENAVTLDSKGITKYLLKRCEKPKF